MKIKLTCLIYTKKRNDDVDVRLRIKKRTEKRNTAGMRRKSQAYDKHNTLSVITNESSTTHLHEHFLASIYYAYLTETKKVINLVILFFLSRNIKNPAQRNIIMKFSYVIEITLGLDNQTNSVLRKFKQRLFTYL